MDVMVAIDDDRDNPLQQSRAYEAYEEVLRAHSDGVRGALTSRLNLWKYEAEQRASHQARPNYLMRYTN